MNNNPKYVTVRDHIICNSGIEDHLLYEHFDYDTKDIITQLLCDRWITYQNNRFYFNEEDRNQLTYYCDKHRHLVCKPYSIENLHRMADELKIKKCWYHGGKNPHYDIPKKRIEEITSQCIIVSTREIIQIIKTSWTI